MHAALIALTLFALLHDSVQAQSTDAVEQFRAGSSAFQAGDYASALDDFEAALAGGMNGPAVHFNIGVSAYRLGHYDRAHTAFEVVARTPAMAGLAYYNLGLVELQRNDTTAASSWFARVAPATEDEQLRQLAATRLTELHPAAAPAPARTWIGYAALGIGHDDNVALISNAEVLGISDSADHFAEAQLAFSVPLASAWRVDAGLTAVNYQDLDTFDQLGLQGGARYRWQLGNWRNDVSLQLTHTLLDGESFESRRSLLLQTTRQLRPDLYARVRYRFSDIEGFDQYTGLSGQRHEAGASLDWNRDAWDIGIDYRIESGDYEDESLTATRHLLRADIERSLGPDWSVLFEISRRHSNYDNDGSEDRSELSLALTRTLSNRWDLVLRHTYTDNDADQAEFDYHGNRISLGVEAAL